VLKAIMRDLFFPFRGLENDLYYILEDDKTYYRNYTGCANTLKANHTILGMIVLESMRYWMFVMHVDGFRIDLASVFSRDPKGNLTKFPAILWMIDSDPTLAGTKIIVEA
jgi:isoamylase